MPDSLESGYNKEVEAIGSEAGPDAEFGGTEARRKLEKRLLLKLDLRMCILVFIYILNYVSVFLTIFTLLITCASLFRLTGIMLGM